MSGSSEHGNGALLTEAVAAVAALIVVVGLWKTGHVWVLALAAFGILVLTFARWAFLPGHRLPKHRTRHLRIRLHLHLHPGRGHATAFEIWWRWSARAIRRPARRTRLHGVTWSAASTFSVLVGIAHYALRIRMPLDEHVVVLAPPRTGKSGWLARVIMHYPGPVVSTTTKADVFSLTSGIRERLGPVHVFNPQRIGGLLSTFRWNPLEGCQEPATAIRRADAFALAVSQKGVEGGGWFGLKAAAFLRALFCAAALDGRDLRTVAAWALGSDITSAQDVLWNHGREQWALELGQLAGEARKTAETIQMSMTQALGFLTDPALAQAVLPAPGAGLDLEAFLQDRGTLYLIAESEHDESPLAPLFACLAGEIHHTAALLGSRMLNGRLDPPLLMALDEVTQICPVPVPSWLADSGGKGIQIIAVAHGEAQLRSRWKADGARTIMDTVGVKLFLPGVTDPDTLAMAAKLCGQAAYHEHGAEHASRHDVMTADMVRQLPPGRALVLRGGLAPVIARLPMAWKDRLYKSALRSGTAVATLAAATASPSLDALTAETFATPARAAVHAPAEFGRPRETVPAEPEHQYPWAGGR
jgi:type IV secretory pathway TraG/TraD family ATPase VirD4